MEGPRYVVHPDTDYARRLDDEDIHAWYHALGDKFKARGFSRQDNASGATSGDLVVTKQSVHEAAVRGFLAYDAGRRVTYADADALEVVLHEHLHCMVRLDDAGNPFPEDLLRYSHPGKALPAILHAFGPNCGLGVNAFTGILRWRPIPEDGWAAGMAWFRRVALDATPEAWMAPSANG